MLDIDRPALRPLASVRPAPARPFHEISTHCLQGFPERRECQQLQIEMTFARHGGLRSIDELAKLSAGRWDAPALLTCADFVHVTRGGRALVPLCQFDLADWSVRPEIAAIVREFSPVFDSWEIALWFVQPNCWLAHRVPIDACQANAAAVLEAARTDRFIAHG